MSEDRQEEQRDPRLNPLSDSFDPLTALYSDYVIFPEPNAPLFDNLSFFQDSASGVTVRETKPKKPPVLALETEAQPVPSTSEIPDTLTVRKTVLSFMEHVEGPLARLRTAMKLRTWIKVTTRTAKGVRGYVIAKLSAFDKMWNLALEDVSEVWTRKIKKKTPCLPRTEGHPKRRVPPPKINVTPISRKYERCERNVPKLMMRGEHVVHIQILQAKEH